MTMPPAVLRSSSSRLTITRSCRGRIFMLVLTPIKVYNNQSISNLCREAAFNFGPFVSTHHKRVLILEQRGFEIKPFAGRVMGFGVSRSDAGPAPAAGRGRAPLLHGHHAPDDSKAGAPTRYAKVSAHRARRLERANGPGRCRSARCFGDHTWHPSQGEKKRWRTN